MTARGALGIGIRLICVYWISTGLVDFLFAAVRAAGVNLGASSSVQRDLIFGALVSLVGLSFLASARQIAAVIHDSETTIG